MFFIFPPLVTFGNSGHLKSSRIKNTGAFAWGSRTSTGFLGNSEVSLVSTLIPFLCTCMDKGQNSVAWGLLTHLIICLRTVYQPPSPHLPGCEAPLQIQRTLWHLKYGLSISNIVKGCSTGNTAGAATRRVSSPSCSPSEQFRTVTAMRRKLKYFPCPPHSYTIAIPSNVLLDLFTQTSKQRPLRAKRLSPA